MRDRTGCETGLQVNLSVTPGTTNRYEQQPERRGVTMRRVTTQATARL